MLFTPQQAVLYCFFSLQFVTTVDRGVKRQACKEIKTGQKKYKACKEVDQVAITSKQTKKAPWTQKEKAAVTRHLGQYIVISKLPGKTEIVKCKSNERCLSQRSWQNIKDFIRNKITANARRGWKDISHD